MGGGRQIGECTYAMGDRCKLTRAHDGGEESDICHFGGYVLIE